VAQSHNAQVAPHYQLVEGTCRELEDALLARLSLTCLTRHAPSHPVGRGPALNAEHTEQSTTRAPTYSDMVYLRRRHSAPAGVISEALTGGSQPTAQQECSNGGGKQVDRRAAAQSTGQHPLPCILVLAPCWRQPAAPARP